MNMLDLAQQAGINPKWSASTQGGEYKSPCPACGGTDRFSIQPEKKQKNCTGYYFCRQCKISGDSIQFTMDFLGYNFQQAKEYLGVTIEQSMRSPFFSTPLKSKIITPPKVNDLLLWQEQASKYLDQAHANLLFNQDILKYLAMRGLPLEAVIRYRLGWLDQDQYFIRTDWGLSEEFNDVGTFKKLWLPKGLIIPTIDFGKIIRLKTRRTDWHKDDAFPKYVAISGSMSGMNIIGDKKHSVLVAVESELDGFALHHAIGDFAVMIAIGGSTKSIDKVTDYYAKKKTLLICPDVDSTGYIVWNTWKQLYPHAINCMTTMGKDIGESIEQGLDVRSWIISKLPEQLKYELKLAKCPWSEQDQSLVDWSLNYINPRVSTSHFYSKVKDEIELGPDSFQAQTRELQDKLLLMKELAEQEFKRREGIV